MKHEYQEKNGLNLMPIYPNPVKHTAEIQFYSTGGQVSLKLYTMKGQAIKILLNKSVAKGSQFVTFNKNGLSRGHYLLVLQNSQERVSQAISIQ